MTAPKSKKNTVVEHVPPPEDDDIEGGVQVPVEVANDLEDEDEVLPPADDEEHQAEEIQPPPQHALVDPEPIDSGAAQITQPDVRVQALRNESSVAVGGVHYSLRAGSVITVPHSIANELIDRKLATRA